MNLLSEEIKYKLIFQDLKRSFNIFCSLWEEYDREQDIFIGTTFLDNLERLSFKAQTLSCKLNSLSERLNYDISFISNIIKVIATSGDDENTLAN